MCRGGWQSSVKRRRRCIKPSALSWGLHSSCRGRPMILFTIFILTDFWKLPCILFRKENELTEYNRFRHYSIKAFKYIAPSLTVSTTVQWRALANFICQALICTCLEDLKPTTWNRKTSNTLQHKAWLTRLRTPQNALILFIRWFIWFLVHITQHLQQCYLHIAEYSQNNSRIKSVPVIYFKI